jgi:hypothetical protein
MRWKSCSIRWRARETKDAGAWLGAREKKCVSDGKANYAALDFSRPVARSTVAYGCGPISAHPFETA